MKKLLALVLALVLAFATTVAFAETTDEVEEVKFFNFEAAIRYVDNAVRNICGKTPLPHGAAFGYLSHEASHSYFDFYIVPLGAVYYVEAQRPAAEDGECLASSLDLDRIIARIAEAYAASVAAE